jgi:L-lactate dehydrogenase complex protein LldG
MSDQGRRRTLRPAGAERGDRGAFLDGLRQRLAAGAPANEAHPLPALGGPVPSVTYLDLDPDDLVGSFTRAASAQRSTVHHVAGDTVPAELLDRLARAEGVRKAVVSADPAAAAAGETLAGLGVDVQPYRPETALDADLGVTGALAGIAATGSIAQDSSRSGGRGASLLPRVHLAILHSRDLVATPADVLRPLGEGGGPPASLVLISSASRSGDIEMILTWGVHGPTSLHVALLRAESAPTAPPTKASQSSRLATAE